MAEEEPFDKLATPAEQKKWARQNSLMYGGLIAVGVVVLQGFLTAPDLGAAGLIAVLGFAIALPLLSVLIMLGELEPAGGALKVTMTDDVAKGLALLSSLTGVVASFWYIDWVAGVVVLAAGVLATLIYGAHFSSSTIGQAYLRRRQKNTPGN